MTYETEDDILKIVRAFENGTIVRSEWKHAEHLTVALYYASQYDFDIAISKMRNGIFNLLNAFKVDLNQEMPYHETLTVFWMRTVDDFRKTKSGCSIIEIRNQLVESFDKDYPLRFYSRERLFSEEARKYFIDGNVES